MGQINEILDDVRDLLLEMDEIQKRLDYIWKYTDRVTGEIKKPKKVVPCKEQQQADLEAGMVGSCFLDYIKKEGKKK